MIPEAAAWAIFLLPLGSFVLIGVLIRPFLEPRFPRVRKLSGYVTILTILGSLVLSAWALQSTLGHHEAIGWAPHTWLTVGQLKIGLGILMDPLTAVMLIIVGGVSLMVQVYSQGYMRGDSGYSRYFAFMSLFTASMLGLVLAANMVQLFVFWELVGLCSYLLIGFWYHRPAAAAAAKKAFIVTRIGDFGLLLALLYLFLHRADFTAQGLDPFFIPDIYEAVKVGAIGGMVVTWLGIGIFAGAVGKSAQFPLHVWLPDAMEGPTPVSALIHAATMVAAGVFLIARMFPVFEASTTTMNTVALIGGFTAVFAASMGLVMNDIKRVLAYSTVSQLGFMVLALGVGAYGAALFHLLTHAFFKALLFLGAGSVHHATGTFDMRYMGGLRRAMPWTYLTFLIASLSLAGIFPLAGFWSKDQILAGAWAGDGIVAEIVFFLAIIGVLMTAFYIFRVLYMTFHGEFRGGVEAEDGASGGERRVHLAESPLVMVLPMILLAGAAVVSGFLLNPLNSGWGLGLIPTHWFTEFVGAHFPAFNPGLAGHARAFDIPLAVYSSVMVLGGISLATMVYGLRWVSAEAVGRSLRSLYTLTSRKYYMDELYEGVIVNRGFYRGACRLADSFDRVVVDGAVDFTGWVSRNVGSVVARLQTGQTQAYGIGIAVGVLVILVVYLATG